MAKRYISGAGENYVALLENSSDIGCIFASEKERGYQAANLAKRQKTRKKTKKERSTI
ncbi:MAG: hypothetical protein IKR83_02205 [Bacteroidales bacterium]|nr:hypothetical protein [Bacteroidales bacterium]